MRFFLYTTLLFITIQMNAQDSISFKRLDFSQNVVGDTAAFVIQNDSSLLMKASADTNKVSLSKPSHYDYGTAWKISIQMNVNPSNSNNLKFYVLSDSSNMAKASNAYYVVMGNNTDEVSLYSQTASGATKVIDGLDKRLDKDTVRVEVIVALADSGQFTLWSKRVDETSFYEEGTTQIKRTYAGTSYLGFVCTYSSKNTDKFIVKEVGIAYPPTTGEDSDGDGSSNEGGGDSIQVPIVQVDNFSLSARSFYNGGEPVYLLYKFPEEGYVARIICFDSAGNKIEELANNTVLDKEGALELKAHYPEGIVVVFAEARTKDGCFIRKKLPIVCGNNR